MNQALSLLIEFNVKLEPVFYLLLKSLMLVEGIARRLYPDFNTVVELKPIVKELLDKHYSAEKMTKHLMNSASELASVVHDLPFNVQDLVQQLKNDGLL